MRYILVILTFLYGVQAHATAWGTACTYTTANYTISLPSGIKISIDPYAPVGTVFFEYLVPAYSGSSYLCNTELSLVTQQGYIYGSGGSTTTLTGYGLNGTYNVYKTNVPGIGVVVRYGSAAFPRYTGAATYTNYRMNYSPFGSTIFDVNIIKYGDIPVGVNKVTISSTSMPDILNTLKITNSSNLDKNPNGEFILKRYTFSPVDIDILTATCDTADSRVDLGSRKISDSANRESGKFASPWVDASIRLNNCPVFYGTGQREDYKGITRNNIMTVSLVPNNPTTSNQGIMPLDSSALSASGIGIQMAWGTAASPQVVDFSTGRGAKTYALTPTQGSSYTVPLVARYVQTTSSLNDVNAGKANGKVTYLINYH